VPVLEDVARLAVEDIADLLERLEAHALDAPALSNETFASVMPMRSASSFDRILRLASMTSSVTTMATVR